MHADAEQARLVKETPAFSPNKSFKKELAMQEKETDIRLLLCGAGNEKAFKQHL